MRGDSSDFLEVSIVSMQYKRFCWRDKRESARRPPQWFKDSHFPKKNDADLEDLPDEVRQAIQFVFVDTVDEVLKAALEPTPKQTTRPKNGASKPSTNEKKNAENPPG